MRALTVRPQWAHAILWHGKRIENRATPIPRTVLPGTRIALHAGRFAPGAWWDDVRDASRGTVPRGMEPYAVPRGRGDFVRAVELVSAADRMQCRAIVGLVTLGACVEWSSGQHPSRPWGDPAARFWWEIVSVQILPRVVPVARGQLGLWGLKKDQESALDDVAHWV